MKLTVKIKHLVAIMADEKDTYYRHIDWRKG